MTPTGYWAWTPENKKVAVQIQLDVVDRLSSLMLDGFGALPRRGAEVGGILLGGFVPGEPRVVRIDDFVAVPCVHKFGPSFVLNDDELKGLESTLRTLKTPDEEGLAVVGYYRSHTRDGLTLSGEDLQYFERFFTDHRQVALLVRPSMMHVSKGGFFVREDGVLQNSTAEFPFRRSEMETGAPPPRRSLESRMERRSHPAFQSEPSSAVASRSGSSALPMQTPAGAPPASAADSSSYPNQDIRVQAAPSPYPGGAHQQPLPPLPSVGDSPRIKRGWIWYPLSFIFLLLGVLLGFQGALSIANDKQPQPQIIQDPYSLNLSVVQSGDDLSLRWDRSSPAVRTAQKGLLEITDGRYSKRVDLDTQQLRTGSVIYQNSSADVKFRLEIYPNDRAVLSESISWKTP